MKSEIDLVISCLKSRLLLIHEQLRLFYPKNVINKLSLRKTREVKVRCANNKTEQYMTL